MPPGNDLKAHFSRLTDEELVVQLVEERLTEEASLRAREELVSRGVAVDQAVSNARSARELANLRAREQQQEQSATLRRVFRFPIRALLGVESPWLVLAIGLLLAYPLYRGTVAAIGSLVLQRPLPVYALPLSYAVLAVFEVASLWLAVALWRCSRRSDVTLVVWFMRLLGLYMAFAAVNSTLNVVTVIQEAARAP